MTEGTPLNPEQLRKLNRDLMEKVIDKAESDPEWKQRLLDDPEAALQEAGFSELQQLRQALTSALVSEDAEVSGQQLYCVYAGFTGLPGPNIVTKYC